jgi:hypothetical protein
MRWISRGKTSGSMVYGLPALPLLHPEWQLHRIEEAFDGALTHPSASPFISRLWDREPGLDNASGLLNAARRQFQNKPLSRN